MGAVLGFAFIISMIVYVKEDEREEGKGRLVRGIITVRFSEHQHGSDKELVFVSVRKDGLALQFRGNNKRFGKIELRLVDACEQALLKKTNGWFFLICFYCSCKIKGVF